MLLIRPAAAVIMILTLAACGKGTAQHEDKRSSGDATAKTSDPTISPEQAADPAQLPQQDHQGSGSDLGSDSPAVATGSGSTSGSASDVTPVGNAVEIVDEVNRTYDSYFFQSYGSLADLFSTGDAAGSSMLCFPAALAYQAEYRRSHAKTPTPQLFDATSATPNSAANAAADVRAMADVCATDFAKGMTVPEGVACVDRLFGKTALHAKITVIGQDAQWATFGMFPHSTNSEMRSVTPADLRAALGRDASVIALVGAYVPGPGTSMKRVKGHFVSFSGYSHRPSFGSDRQELIFVDPSIDYRSRPAGTRFERTVMAPPPATVSGMLPQHTAFELRGLDIGAPSGATVVLESVIIFE